MAVQETSQPAPSSIKKTRGMSRRARQDALEGYLFLLPNLLGFLIFFAFPLLISFYYSFTDYNLFTTPKFVGLRNYINAVGIAIKPEAYQAALAEGRSLSYALGRLIVPSDELFWVSLGNTFVYAIGVLLLSVIPAFLLAWLLNSRLRGMSIFRGLFYIPVVASIVGSSLVWFWLYHRENGVFNFLITGGVNIINQIIGPLGGKLSDPLIGWLVTPQWALFSLIVMTAWATIGYDMVIFLAALQAIPGQLFEAAYVDGATRFQILRKIIFPMLTPTTFFILVTNIISVLQVFAEPYIMTQGGPANSTLTIVYYLYQKGFQRFQMGYGTSLAWLIFFVILIITLIQFRVANRWVYQEG